MDTEETHPLTPLQEGLLFSTLSAGEEAVSTETQRVEIRGALRMDAFEESWRRVLISHAVLRSAFLWDDLKEPLQTSRPLVTVPLATEDWSGRDDLDARFERFAREPFDPRNAPMMRMLLVRLEEERHVLLWCWHHLVLDRWSAASVIREVFETYDALCAGETSVAVTPRPYSEYVAWLRAQDMHAAEQVWRSELRGFTTPTHLDLPDIDGAQASGDIEREVVFSSAATHQLQSAMRRHDITLNTLVQAAWALLLSRYSRTHDVVFGNAVTGRSVSFEGAEHVVGPCINTLPVRIRIGKGAVAEWLRGIQSHQSQLQPYDYVPLVRIQQWSGIRGGLSLFESIVMFENVPPVCGGWRGDLQIDGLVHVRSVTPYPFAVTAGLRSADSDEQFFVRLTCSRKRVNTETAARLLAHLTTLIERLGESDEHELVQDLSMLDAEERHRLVHTWNDTATAFPQHRCIHDLFSEQVARAPRAIALVRADAQMTYEELDRRSSQFAHYLRAQGVGPEVIVGVCLRRSLDMVVAVLGILKAGGAYLPLDPDHPPERQRFMISDARVRHLVREIPSSKVSAYPTTPVESSTQPGNLAYVIYTSGSTGKPKGAMLSHRSVVNYLAWAASAYRLQEGSGAPVNTPLTFDATVTSFLVPLIGGRCVTLLPDDETELHELSAALSAQHDYSLIKVTPAQLSVLQQHAPDATWQSSTRAMVIGGEALHADHIAHWHERAPHIRLLNEYGPTETVVGCATYEVARGPLPARVPIGRPIANMQMFVLDDALEPTPVGVVGELYIGGCGVARGYLARPGLTAERFIPHPFASDGSRLYRTGDLARHRSDGELEFIGRADHQVKIRGYRIEPGEVEARLAQHPRVREAVVTAQTRGSADTQLVAHVVAAEDGPPDVHELRAYLRRLLPEYMVPARIALLEKLPLTVNGKVDRNALLAVDAEGLAPASYVAPRTAVEASIARIWAELLGLQRVGIDDNYFDVGGDSLSLHRVLVRIRREVDGSMNIVDLFNFPTIRQLAAHRTGSDSRQEAAPDLEAMRAAKRKEAFRQRRQ